MDHTPFQGFFSALGNQSPGLTNAMTRQTKPIVLGSVPRPPWVPLLRALWYLLDGIWGLSKGSWGVLVGSVLWPLLGMWYILCMVWDPD